MGATKRAGKSKSTSTKEQQWDASIRRQLRRLAAGGTFFSLTPEMKELLESWDRPKKNRIRAKDAAFLADAGILDDGLEPI